MSEILFKAAHEFEKALETSDEFVQLKKLYDDVRHDESAKNIFENFRSIQLKLQEKQLMGHDITQEEAVHAQKCAQLAQQNAKIAALLKAEERLSRMMLDLNKIMMKPLEDLYEIR